MNYGEGYNAFLEDETVRFRISVKPYHYVKGELRGTQDQFDLLTQAIEADDWHVGTAEALCRNGCEELHVTVTHSISRAINAEVTSALL